MLAGLHMMRSILGTRDETCTYERYPFRSLTDKVVDGPVKKISCTTHVISLHVVRHNGFISHALVKGSIGMRTLIRTNQTILIATSGR